MKKKKGYLMVIAAGILWGTIGLFTSVLSRNGMPDTVTAFLRLATGTVFLGMAILMFRGTSAFRIDRRGFFWCILLGLFPQALFNVSYTSAITQNGMATGAVLLYTAPVFVCIMSRIFFKEHLTSQKILALIINLIGCAAAVTGGTLSGLQISSGGLAAGLAAGFFYSTLTIISTAALKEYDPLTVLFYGMLIGSVLLGLIAGPRNLVQVSITPYMIAMILGLGLIPTCIAYMIYMIGLSEDLEASKVPVAASIEIVSASVFGTVLLHQDFSLGKGLGIIVILLSIVLMNRETAPRTEAETVC